MRIHKPTRLADRFWAKVRKGPGCWEWTAFKMRSGYGTMGLGSRAAGKEFAHRVSWLLHFGPIPPDKYVCHRCDNPSCVRPDHLFLGSPLENQDDMRAKGRSRCAPSAGERNGNSKLTEAEVLSIFRMRASGMTQVQIAARLGVTHPMVGFILRGQNWKHLTEKLRA